MDIKTLVIVVGLALGALLVVAAAVVGIRKKSFTMGEILIAAIGMLLVGLSLFSKASIQAGDFGVEFETLQENTEQVASSAAVVSEEVRKLSEATRKNQEQIVVLARKLRSNSSDDEVVRTIQEFQRASPRVNLERLTAATQQLEISSEAIARMRTATPRDDG